MKLRQITDRSTRRIRVTTVDDESAVVTDDSAPDVTLVPNDTDAADLPSDGADAVAADPTAELQAARRGWWRRSAVRVIVPALVVGMSAGSGYLAWKYHQDGENNAASAESVIAATEATIALLSYTPDTVDAELEAARARLTGEFLDSYTSLTRDVVIPGAQEKKITATATVPAAAPVSASNEHAVVLLFVNQTVTVGTDAPTNTASTVQLSLDKVDGRWLVSAFDPI